MTNATAGWMRSSDRQLFAWLHQPVDSPVRGGIVLCPSLFSEYYDAHTTFRVLADRFAESGFAALRFDFSGTGDSSGSPGDLSDVGNWCGDIQAAVDELRNGGATYIIAVAMRGAANLLAGAAGQSGADAVILWDPFASGRAFARAAILLHNSDREPWDTEPKDSQLAIDERDATAPANNGPFGFDLPTTFVQSLKSLNLQDVRDAQRALILTRDGLPPASLRNGEAERIGFGLASGQESMLETYPDIATIPYETIDRIVEWSASQVSDRASQSFGLSLAPKLAVGDDSAVESVVRIGDVDGTGLFGITTESRQMQATLTCLFFNSGTQHHIGPNRLYVDLARQLAGDGVRSIRFDLSGIGDSPTRRGFMRNKAYSPAILEDLDLAVQFAGDGPKVAIGLCSGGYHALEAAARNQLNGVIAIHYSLENVVLRNRLDMHAPDRRITQLDRRWLRALNRGRWGRAVVWRIPGPVWRLLDKLRLQDDVAAGVRHLAALGQRVVLVVERTELRRPRWWQLVHARRAKPVIVPSTADHALHHLSGRTDTAEVVRTLILGWSRDSAPAARRTS